MEYTVLVQTEQWDAPNILLWVKTRPADDGWWMMNKQNEWRGWQLVFVRCCELWAVRNSALCFCIREMVWGYQSSLDRTRQSQSLVISLDGQSPMSNQRPVSICAIGSWAVFVWLIQLTLQSLRAFPCWYLTFNCLLILVLLQTSQPTK